MPIYTFECDSCDHRQEEILPLEKRDSSEVQCEICGNVMIRLIDAHTIGKPAFQMGAVLNSGEKVPGHFGKFARKK